MKINKLSHLGLCIASLVSGYIYTLAILCCLFLEIKPIVKPKNVPEGAVYKGDHWPKWIYEVEHNDSIVHLLIYYPDGDLALDADFENKGIDNVDQILVFDEAPSRIYLNDSLACNMVKSYGGILHELCVDADSLPVE